MIKLKPLLIAAGYGGLSGMLTAAVLAAMEALSALLWQGEPSPWRSFLTIAAGGALIALLRVIGGGDEPDLAAQLQQARTPQALHRRQIALLAAMAIVAVAFGGAVGPEAGTLAVVAELSAWVALAIGRSQDERALIGEAGAAGALGAIYGAPPGGLLVAEGAPTAQAARDGDAGPRRALLLLAAVAGLGGFHWVRSALLHGGDLRVECARLALAAQVEPPDGPVRRWPAEHRQRDREGGGPAVGAAGGLDRPRRVPLRGALALLVPLRAEGVGDEVIVLLLGPPGADEDLQAIVAEQVAVVVLPAPRDQRVHLRLEALDHEDELVPAEAGRGAGLGGRRLAGAVCEAGHDLVRRQRGQRWRRGGQRQGAVDAHGGRGGGSGQNRQQASCHSEAARGGGHRGVPFSSGHVGTQDAIRRARSVNLPGSAGPGAGTGNPPPSLPPKRCPREAST